LGAFPDKVLINTLSMIAEDYSKSSSPQHLSSSQKIYNLIKALLLSDKVPPNHKLPLVYVIDSILKNARGTYPSSMSSTIPTWMDHVHKLLSQDTQSRTRLRKVWNTWREFQIFPEHEWKQMGQCFLQEDDRLKIEKTVINAKARAAGILRDSNGNLLLESSLRQKMQHVLDDVQNDGVVQELDKVSLERLADINPTLLVEIKKAAEEMNHAHIHPNHHDPNIRNHNNSNTNNTSAGNDAPNNPNNITNTTDTATSTNTTTSTTTNTKHPLFIETRAPDVVKQCQEWNKINFSYNDACPDAIKTLNHYVRSNTTATSTTSTTTTTNNNNNTDMNHSISDKSMENILGVASVTASQLTLMIQSLQLAQKSYKDSLHPLSSTSSSSYLASKLWKHTDIDKSKFTTEGLAERDDNHHPPAYVSRLYEAGLPFLSSSDGRRFATQAELSSHLDTLFQRARLEKTMERSEEREWYHDDRTWENHWDATMNPNGTSLDGGGTGNGTGTGMGTMDNNPHYGNPNRNPNDNTTQSSTTALSPTSSFVPADESRDRCVLCGVSFKMHFDQDCGEWMYGNCTEIDVLNDDAAEHESEPMLVHATCWNGLGSPEFLTREQILQ